MELTTCSSTQDWVLRLIPPRYLPDGAGSPTLATSRTTPPPPLCPTELVLPYGMKTWRPPSAQPSTAATLPMLDPSGRIGYSHLGSFRFTRQHLKRCTIRGLPNPRFFVPTTSGGSGDVEDPADHTVITTRSFLRGQREFQHHSATTTGTCHM